MEATTYPRMPPTVGNSSPAGVARDPHPICVAIIRCRSHHVAGRATADIRRNALYWRCARRAKPSRGSRWCARAVAAQYIRQCRVECESWWRWALPAPSPTPDIIGWPPGEFGYLSRPALMVEGRWSGLECRVVPRPPPIRPRRAICSAHWPTPVPRGGRKPDRSTPGSTACPTCWVASRTGRPQYESIFLEIRTNSDRPAWRAT